MPKPAGAFSNNYDLASLQECMKKGWRDVAALAKELHEFGGLDAKWMGWWPKGPCAHGELCQAAERLFRHTLGYGFSSCLAEDVMEDAGAAKSSQSYDIALRYWREVVEVVLAGTTHHAIENVCSIRWPGNWPRSKSWRPVPKWNPHMVPLFELLLRAFAKPSPLEELYWRVVTQICLEERVSELDALGKKLQSGSCFTIEDQWAIDQYTVYGSPAYRQRTIEDGSVTVSRHYDLTAGEMNAFPEDGVAVALLVAPAYDLGEKWIQSQAWPRYETICRAPSCGRHFYSGHSNARDCPPAKCGDACRKEWHRYMRWLEKQRLDAESKWADKSLQQQFSEQDKARTEIRDEQISRAHGIGVREL